ncbi:Golgi apparatus membrane protein TVP38 [Grifola frondosa]|uniref:Golgi apparatus membrane protein TVP38 n=1 Tax=Grifola frondosa TaxID=5627 RepID=A0A1C7M7I1_GRIFR|nr:Golgi apparatus membrane protein TVP38 [Grifola frondosa]
MASYPAYGIRQAPLSNVPYSTVSITPNQYPYPPNGTRYGASASSLSSDDSNHGREPTPFKKNTDVVVNLRVIDWGAMMKWRYWIRKEWAWYYVAFIIATAILILFTVCHTQIVNWLRPAANWMHDLPFGWLIPIAVLFVISFPPLFGHEIVAILCGLVWGLWIGFAIVAAGTFLGELGNFYAFKYCCAARGAKLERTKISYACLARVVREGGFKIALIARLSAIPGHFTTAVFSTCGMGVMTFSIAAILSLPKQFITVYLGVALEQSENGSSSKSDNIIKDVVLIATTIITFGAMWYIYHKMNQVKVQVIYDRRKARQAKLAMADLSSRPYGVNPTTSAMESTTSFIFNPTRSDTELPLNPKGPFGSSKYQQWDQNGRAVGYAGDPTLYMPQPQRAPSRPPTVTHTYRPQQRTPSLQGTTYPNQHDRYTPVRQDSGPSLGDAASGHEGSFKNPFSDTAKVQPGTGTAARQWFISCCPSALAVSQTPSCSVVSTTYASFARDITSSDSTVPSSHSNRQLLRLPAKPGQSATASTFVPPRHEVEPSDVSYTAQGGHSRSGSDATIGPYTAYESSASLQQRAGSPPAYSSLSPR